MADTDSRSGTTYANRAIVELVDALYHPQSEAMALAVRLLDELRLPKIQIAPGDGALLAVLLRLAAARRVVEVGCLSGYSALWMLRGMDADGRLWTCESDPRAAAAARRVFAAAKEDHRVVLVEGPALVTLPQIASNGPFDAVFIDADKEAYPDYAEWALANLRPGGLLLADNAFLFGQLAGVEATTATRRAEIAAMQRFHRILADRCSPATVVPTPDGLAIAVAR